MEYKLDAKGKSLGRIASEAAVFLMGKNDPKFQKHILSGNKVQIINASKIKISPRKIKQVEYTRYTGYPGGLRTQTMKEVVAKKGYAELFHRAVYGMLPDNKLRARMMKNLVVTE